ncbi:MAG TPA: Fic family protein [Phycisphaerales bacterium]|nr:Fic family protein [Phycisphaerales bacterium]
MVWNWQHSDWPEFQWNCDRISQAEKRFLLGSGILLGVVTHLDASDRDRLIVEAMSDEAVTTSQIEGELLNRDSVQSSIRRQLGLDTDNRRVQPAERGIGEMMVALYKDFAAPLDHDTLFKWHGMLMQGRRDLRDIGAYRAHAEPMQIVSSRLDTHKVHFEAPPSKVVASEMERFIAWFNASGENGTNVLPAVTRAGVAHLYFESIHPFEDGNGRIGRAISEKALAQALGQASFTGLSPAILARRPLYYSALEASQRGNEITEWLAWFAAITLEAQERTRAQVEFLLDKTKFLDRFRDRFNKRQYAALLRMLREGPEGFKGGLSASNYAAITNASPATSTRDLAELVEAGALQRTGERKHTRYRLPIQLRSAPQIVINSSGDIQIVAT